jgi:pimeloyl-ACP methyl ester carboxylesterase
MKRKIRQKKRIPRSVRWLFYGFVLMVVALVVMGRNSQPLESWHSVHLTEEFTAKKADEIPTFDDYLKLEGRLFEQLEKEVYNSTGTGPEYTLVRYSPGSAADPQHLSLNWNRTFELTVDDPVGGVLLLHGMSDSPYSLRTLGQALNDEGYYVLGLRLPGHGTAPSGLMRVKWQDMAAAVRLGMERLSRKVKSGPVHIMGYSTGASLGIDYALKALDGEASPLPASLVLVSPAIGVHPSAALANARNRLGLLPGLGWLSWLSILPEFDPYKYNSFATNAGTQVHKLTGSVSRRITAKAQSGPIRSFPPVLVFKSTVDATVTTDAVVDRLLIHLEQDRHELVLFDINRTAVASPIMISDPGPFTDRLMAQDNLPFTLTLITNENPESREVVAHRKAPFSTEETIEPLNVQWPRGVISLSHIALPFPPDDPLYGVTPPEDPQKIFLGQISVRGERGLILFPADWLLRIRHNPFYDYLENRTLEWMKEKGDRYEEDARRIGEE